MKKLPLIIAWIVVPIFAVWAAFNTTTLQDLEQDVKNNLATTADPFHPDSVLDDFINLACRDVASYGVIKRIDSVVVSAGDQIVALNEDVLQVLAVFPCTSVASRGYDRWSFADWGKIGGATQLTSTNYFDVQPWAFYGGNGADTVEEANLWLYPSHSGVDDTLIVVYTAEAFALSADSDTTNIPYPYRGLVVIYATALSFARAQEYDKASWWFSLYDQELKKRLLFEQYKFDYIIAPKQIAK